MDLGSPRHHRLSTTEYAVSALRAAIQEGRIRQGEHLREDEIARALDVGRGTVREAVQHLVQEGLVEHKLHRGAFVRMLLPADMLDVYVAREAIEVFAAQRVVEMQQPDLRPLERALAGVCEALADRRWPSSELISADIAFHAALVNAAESPRLSRAYDTLATESLMVLLGLPPYPPDTYADDHATILTAMQRRDLNAPALVRDHLRLSATLIQEHAGNIDAAPGAPARS